MDRPPSKLVASSPQLQWQFRSNLSIFIHTLHLLNLDLLPDWPPIADSTFSSSKSVHNLQARVKSTEWALYHLFRVYSPSETKARLSAHFPSTTPIQGKNLRAGLYKWLMELKTTGVLRREIVLRKTMLDECKGEKFEEVLARFSMVVLRKQLAEQGKNAHAAPGPTPKPAEEQDVDKLVPLILAHRFALQQCLRRRQDLEGKVAAYSKHLIQIRNEVDTNLQDLHLQSVNASDAEEPLPSIELDALRDQVSFAFAGDRRWARFIFEGTSSSTSATSMQKLPQWPFEDDDSALPEHIRAEGAEDETDEPMLQLQSMISHHEQRINRLTQLRDSILPETEAHSGGKLGEITAEEPTASAAPAYKAVSSVPKLRFNRHQELNLRL